MTRKGPAKSVDAQFWQGRRGEARAFHLAAKQAIELAEPGESANPIVSLIVLAAIAYTDSVTAKRAQVVNQQDHARAVRLLRDVLRNQLPGGQERALRRILRLKDEAQYGARSISVQDARHLLGELDEFVRFIEDLIR
jgi:hypothetical protein